MAVESWRGRRFDMVEVALGVVLAALCGLIAATELRNDPGFRDQTAAAELARLESAYGPGHYSQFYEEWIIRDHFQDRRNGVFVDVGANHYRDGSTTFFLEERLGWSGIAIDPQPGFDAEYRRFRPRTRFFSLFVSDTSDDTATLYMSQLTTQTASDRPLAGSSLFERRLDVPTITLTDLLDRLGMRQVDFLSIDVELSEPKVLGGFDIDRFQPAFVCIEAHAEVRQMILDYFARHGYVVAGRYLRADELNLYFTPLAPSK